jgi:hypothetical protein
MNIPTAGGMQIQGICAYYYGEKHPEMGTELDRCKINTMVDNPYFSANDKKKPNQCRDGRSNCEDCRTTDISNVLSSHFTICQKPWECTSHWDGNSEKLCSKLHSEWFRIRRSFEQSRTDELRQLPDAPSQKGTLDTASSHAEWVICRYKCEVSKTILKLHSFVTPQPN